MKTVAELIQGFLDRDKIALVYKSGFRTFTLTYQELHHKILQTAAMLDSNGLKKGDKILLWGFNSPEWGIVFLSCALKGIIVVPIDFLATGDFVEKIQKQVKAKAIFHSEFKILPDIGISGFVLEHLYKDISSSEPKAVMENIGPDDLLEIVYTSGTTGDPKGVMITHGNLMSNVTSIKQVVDVQPSQTFLSLLPLSHLFEQNPGFLSPLSAGCTVVYMRGLRPNLIFKVLSEERVTNIVIVPRLLKLFETSIRREVEAKGKTKIFNKLLGKDLPRALKKLLFRPVHKKFGTHFGYFISGGAPLSKDLELFWTGLGFRLVQGYGLTECSPVLTVNPLNASRDGSVGFAIPGVELKLNQGHEVLARGPNITQGYFERPDKTKELFDDGWMKTGDIGELDDQGYLFLKGRQKDVIVTGAGMNVYPEDIEAELTRQPGVKDACVIGLPTPQGEQVHAELILSEATADAKKLVNKANQALNDSQQITSFGVWAKEDFPRTTTMKVKKMLVLAEVKNQHIDAAAPSNDTHTKLHVLIASVCEVDVNDIRPEASLASDLHLTSVGRIELIARLEQDFNLDINEDEITATTTILELENIIKLRAKVRESDIFRRWLLSMPLRITRGTFNGVLANNVLRLFVRRECVGTENLKDIKGPVIFIANHVGYFDAPTVMMSLPWRFRHKVAAAAWKEYFENEGRVWFKNKYLQKLQLGFYYEYASIMVNAYPFPKKTGFKRSLEYTGELIDKDWSIMFFPEGEHSPSGELQPFRTGIGWIVKEMNIPVVPIKHSGFENIMAGDDIQLPRRGKVTIKFGKPVMLDSRNSIPQITSELERILKDL